MALNRGQDAVTGAARSATGAPAASQGLDWLWQHLRDVPNPHALDCGPVSPATLQLLLRRGAKFYGADLMTPLLQSDARLWDRSGKTPVFLPSEFLNLLPPISERSLTVILSWNLFDLAPHEALPDIVTRLFSLLQPLGLLFCALREPQAKTGPEHRWWLESLTSPRNEADAKRPFPYPAITNREIERLLPDASIKTFLTRSGRREILAMRRE
ncbi:MAG TPA: hypothetical protein VGY31_12480 [Terriglobia bacterium]|nr:hypothetical protein [Terriglobia bacterium]